MNRPQLDCIVRFHDVRRLNELDRCLFSLVGQSYRPLHVILALQRFSESDIVATQHALAPLLAFPEAPSLSMVNFEQPEPKDARTVLLNEGLKASRGRYVAFLDYDDLLYPEAYSLLVARLQAVDAAIAFATVRVLWADIYPQFVRMTSVEPNPFGRNRALLDLFRENFCPIHSFIVDKEKIETADLRFDPELFWEEDYEFLLRICSKYPSDFGLVNVKIGDYYYKTDGSNTVNVARNSDIARVHMYKWITAVIEVRRRTTYISDRIREDCGIGAQKQMTIRDLLDQV